MSILIKGMEMPNNCMDCPFKGFDGAGRRGNICTIDESVTLHAVLDGVDVKFVRMGDCPLIFVPTHGDLIDRSQLMKTLKIAEECENCESHVGIHCAKGSFVEACEAICDAPTIIEAEGET